MAVIARDLIRSFVDRIERLDEEIKALNADKRDVFAEAKGNGLDVKALKTVIQRRRMDPEELQEQDAVVDLYLQALGMRGPGTETATRAGARENAAAGAAA